MSIGPDELAAALNRNTEALRDLKTEVTRLCDTFGKILSAEPQKRGKTVEEAASEALIGGLGRLLGGKGRKR